VKRLESATEKKPFYLSNNNNFKTLKFNNKKRLKKKFNPFIKFKPYVPSDVNPW
jgi:hypothetical protein